MAFVRGVIAAAAASTSMFAVAGSTSTKTGVPPAYKIAFAEDRNVIGVVMTSSRGPTPAASMERCREAVACAVHTTAGTPRYSSKAFSKA